MKSIRLSRALEWATPDAQVPLLKMLGAALVSFAVAGSVALGAAIVSEPLALWARVGLSLFCFFFLHSVIYHRIVDERPTTRIEWLTALAAAFAGAGVIAWMVDYASHH